MYVHDLDPFAVQIFEGFGIRWYGLSYMLGFLFAFYFLSWLVRYQRAGLTPPMVGDFITYMAIGTLVGGRLGYVLFYSPDLFGKFMGEFPFWGVLAVNKGGMASHGGMIGIVAACFLYAKKMGLNTFYLFDLVAVSGPVGVFMGRIANFINGELVGREAPSDFPLAVKFPSDILLWPDQEFSKLQNLGSVVEKVSVDPGQWEQWVSSFHSQSNSYNAIYDTLQKIVDRIQEGDIALKTLLAPHLVPRYPSQLFGALGEGLFLFIVLLFLWKRPRKPGFIASCFVLLYAFVRIVDEQFRLPDAHIGFQWAGLTRGQWLSVGMVFFGLILLFVVWRSHSMTVSGWGKGTSLKLGRKD